MSIRSLPSECKVPRLSDNNVLAVAHEPGGMCPVSDKTMHDPLVNLAEAKDCLHLMLLEFGDVHIETLGQLLKLTNTAEREYMHICCRRLISG